MIEGAAKEILGSIKTITLIARKIINELLENFVIGNLLPRDGERRADAVRDSVEYFFG
jgi:hypothetical protein